MVNWYKIKRIMLWTKQVRPPVQEYYYDFVWKDYQTCVDDGWTFQDWNTHWEFTSNWLHSTYWHADHGYKFRSVVRPINLTSINKATFTGQVYWNYWFLTWALAIWFIKELVNGSNKCTWYFTFFDWTDIKWKWYVTPSSNYLDQDENATWTYNYTIEIDFINKTIKMTLEWKWTVTGTLSDSDITTTKTYPYRWIRRDANWWYIKTINAKFE